MVLVTSPAILITDDDSSLRATLSSVFEPRGFRTLQASDGQEALDILHNQEVHIALFDMHMPRLTGLETLRLAKQFKADLPCILMSAEADEQMIKEALSWDALAVLRKPVTRSHVMDRVREALMRCYQWYDASKLV